MTTESASTRSRILGAAVELLDDVGFGAITTRAVSERAGVNNALVHYHFGSKAALLVEAALARLDAELREPVRLLAAAPSPGVGAAAVIRWLGGLDRDDPGVRTIVDLTVEAFRNPEVRPTIAAVLDTSRAEIAEVVAAVVPDRPGEPPSRGVADILAALFDGLLLHRIIDPGFDLEPAARAIETWPAGGGVTAAEQRP